MTDATHHRTRTLAGMSATRTVQCPIIVGRDDVMTPVKYAEFLHQKIRGSRLVIVENAGHAVPMERGDEVNRAIDEFVTSLEQPATAR